MRGPVGEEPRKTGRKKIDWIGLLVYVGVLLESELTTSWSMRFDLI